MRTGLADTVAMVRATHFGANPETRASNAFQCGVTEAGALQRALKEQAALAEALRASGVTIVWLEPAGDSPDAVFPNNWFSTDDEGRLVLYPMYAPSRRRERIADIDARLAGAGFQVRDIVDLSLHEHEARFLEGTGSLVLDRVHRIAYACPSVRTDLALARAWARQFDFELFTFEAADPAGLPLYHTNVIMSLGAGVTIVCLDAIPPADRERLLDMLRRTEQRVVAIDWDQVEAFAGNQLFLQGSNGPVLALSGSADRSLREDQKAVLDSHARRISVDIATIERHGGGSVRCMLAEIFLPRQTG